ncbi:nucleoside:proton symporter [Oscillatoria sp. FACHB-1406]|nr:nucleoside:proton symporter [Oscillatoria sp. FACHB-1406]
MNPTLNLISLFGIFALCAIAWLGSEERRIVPWKTLAVGIGLQLLAGVIFFILGVRGVEGSNHWLDNVFQASGAGTGFLFGSGSAPEPAQVPDPGAAARWIAGALGSPDAMISGEQTELGANASFQPSNLSSIFAFRNFPAIVFWSALVSLLYGLNLIQPVVRIFAWIFQRAMNLSGAESLAGAASLFVGIESAIAVKPFLLGMTRSELCAVLASCFGSLGAPVFWLYIGLLRPTFPDIFGHFVAASFLTIPACFVISKLLVPETEIPETMGDISEFIEGEREEPNGAIARFVIGAIEGLKVVLGIVAVVIAILGIIKLFDLGLRGLSSWLITVIGADLQSDSLFVQFLSNPLSNLLGMLFLPLAFLTGISLEWQELWNSSLLIGRRLIETSFPPYQSLVQLQAAGEMSDRALLIVTYVLRGFAHLAGFGIFVGGIAALVPERRSEIAAVGFKALWAATLATLMTGCIVGIFS